MRLSALRFPAFGDGKQRFLSVVVVNKTRARERVAGRFSHCAIAGLDPAIHAEAPLAVRRRAVCAVACHHGPPGSKPGGDDVGVTPMVTMTARNEARHCERQRSNPGRLARRLDCFVAALLAMTRAGITPCNHEKGEPMRRKLSAPAWRFPRRMTLKQWSVLPTASGTLIWRRRNARCWNIGAIARTHAAVARSAASFRTRVFGSASRP